MQIVQSDGQPVAVEAPGSRRLHAVLTQPDDVALHRAAAARLIGRRGDTWRHPSQRHALRRRARKHQTNIRKGPLLDRF